TSPTGRRGWRRRAPSTSAPTSTGATARSPRRWRFGDMCRRKGGSYGPARAAPTPPPQGARQRGLAPLLTLGARRWHDAGAPVFTNPWRTAMTHLTRYEPFRALRRDFDRLFEDLLPTLQE